MGIRRGKIAKLSDNELVMLYQSSRKQEYFGELYLRYLLCIYGVCLKCFSEENAAADAACRLYDELAAHAGTAVPDDSPGEWIYRETVRFCGAHRMGVSGETAAEPLCYSGERMAVLSLLEKDDNWNSRDFMARTEELAKPQKECLRLFFEEGKSFEDIAVTTGYLSDDVRGKYIEGALAALAAVGEAGGMTVRPAGHSRGRVANLKSYIKGDRTGANAHEIELAALGDPFLSEALEGYAVNPVNPVERAEQIGRETGLRVFGRQALPKWYYWSAAGILAVLAVAVVYYAVPSGAETAGTEEAVAVTEAEETPDVPPLSEADTAAAPAKAFVSDTAGGRISPAAVAPKEETADSARPLISADTQSHGAPRIGFKLFNEYLRKAMAVPAGARGDVVLTFHVNKFGRPSGIRIVQGLTKEANGEAIRLITSGPEWEATEGKVSVTIHFR